MAIFTFDEMMESQPSRNPFTPQDAHPLKPHRRPTMALNPIITVSLYPGRYMRIDRHTLNDDGKICVSHTLNTAGEWADYKGAVNTELPPLVAIRRDAAALKAYIATLQEYLDEMEADDGA